MARVDRTSGRSNTKKVTLTCLAISYSLPTSSTQPFQRRICLQYAFSHIFLIKKDRSKRPNIFHHPYMSSAPPASISLWAICGWESNVISYFPIFNKICLFVVVVLTVISSLIINNYWMRLSMISRIIKTEVCVICRSLRLRQIIHDIMRTPNSIIVLLYIF